MNEYEDYKWTVILILNRSIFVNEDKRSTYRNVNISSAKFRISRETFLKNGTKPNHRIDRLKQMKKPPTDSSIHRFKLVGFLLNVRYIKQLVF